MALRCVFGHDWDVCVCRRCGKGRGEDESGRRVDHDWGEWVILPRPPGYGGTDREPHTKERRCRRCGRTETTAA